MKNELLNYKADESNENIYTNMNNFMDYVYQKDLYNYLEYLLYLKDNPYYRFCYSIKIPPIFIFIILSNIKKELILIINS